MTPAYITESVRREHARDDLQLPIAQWVRELDGKPKASDYDSAVQEVLALAVQYYKGRLSSEDAFPSKMAELRWAKHAWTKARVELDVDLQYNGELIKMITGYSANLRGEIKTTARGLVAQAYGFDTSANPTVVARNRDRVTTLKLKDTFVWRGRSKVLASRSGLYEAKIFQLVINKVYFKSSSDDGVALRSYYRPFPIVGIALIATAVQCAIDEWTTGHYKRVTFSDAVYSKEYQRHHQQLTGYVKKSSVIVENICTRMFEDGWCVIVARCCSF
ncbi:hypothetical protein OH77DRAFT_1415542 [Trametes cingulata]|nr:hypothetical protein OH77DRAFT_1415542 [Trametes cingulata]